MAQRYLTAPLPISTMPPGIPYIVGNEAAERFSFYGMRGILTIYMVKFLVDWHGQPATYTDEEARLRYHLFVASAYFFPILGAIISDWLLGKYRTILYLSLVYCGGHLALATVPGREGLLVGLLLIALGSGGIKPCVSANVGDQFGEQNKHLLSRVFSWFYFSINLGAAASSWLTPVLLRDYGPHVAFAVPGILMGVATLIFWMGRDKYVHIPPGGSKFLKESFSREGLSALGKLIPLYAFVAVFWALYDQTGSAWVLQLEKMDRHWSFLGRSGEWESSQVQAVNPVLVLILIPLFSYIIYPALGRIIRLTELKKISIGFFVTVVAFGLSAWIERQIQNGRTMSYLWQVLAYVILTSAEILVSITCLEFSYTQAPNKMKSLIMSFYLLSVSAGNALAATINGLIQLPDGGTRLPGASYYWFFTGLMLAASLGFLVIVATFRERTYIQEG